MNKPELGTMDRRITLAALAAAAAGLALPIGASARIIRVRGMAGGGLAHFEQGEANFSLAVTRLTFEEEQRELVVGSVIWVDTTAGVTLASTHISDYGILELPSVKGEARRVRGQMSVNGADEYPFQMDLIDAGIPGSGLDSVNLTVGANSGTDDAATPESPSGFAYAAAGPVTIGDLQDIDFDLDTTTAFPIPATPAA